MYRDVSSLIKDAAWLKHYVASAMCIESEALGLAHSAFGKIALDQKNTNTNGHTNGTASRPASVVTPQDPQFGANPASISPSGSTSASAGAPPPQPPAPMAGGLSRTTSSASTGQQQVRTSGGSVPPTNNPYV